MIIALIALISITGCKKLVEVDPPDDQLVSGIVFSNDSMANAAVIGLYSNIMGQTRYFLNGAMSLYTGLSADELIRTSPLNNEDQFFNNSLSAANVLIGNNIWKAAYAYLYQCNISLEGLEHSRSVSTDVKKRLTAEVKFVRALCFYYLVNLFGDVPLVNTSNAEKNAMLPRSSIEAVYNQIKADLQEAGADLPDVMENTRPNKMACMALLARVYLFRENWAEAELTASSIINSSQYNLTDLSNVFKSGSRETIFQLAPVLNQINSAEGRIFIPVSSSAVPFYTVTNNLLIAFELGDLRKNIWLKSVQPNSNGPIYTYPFKYKINISASGTPATEYNVVLRLAEQYLIRAEARAQQNKINEAIADINIIRNRAALASILLLLSKSQCLAAIEQERRVELFAEWGHRWLDLKRLNKANTILSVIKGSNWHETDQLYPIPLSELETDPNLVQNAGY